MLATRDFCASVLLSVSPPFLYTGPHDIVGIFKVMSSKVKVTEMFSDEDTSVYVRRRRPTGYSSDDLRSLGTCCCKV